MTKKQMIEAFAKLTGETKKRSGELIDAFLEVGTEGLVADKELKFVGFGTFKVKQTKERVGRNFKTGEAIKIAPKMVVKFEAGSNLAKAVK